MAVYVALSRLITLESIWVTLLAFLDYCDVCFFCLCVFCLFAACSGTSACPPYHLAIVVGGLSAELTLKTVKMASAKYLDNLPTTGNAHGRAFRDLETEVDVLKLTQEMGIGAQFGGKYFCHDVRVIRLPRHGASCPVGMGVSCSADRQVKGKVSILVY